MSRTPTKSPKDRQSGGNGEELSTSSAEADAEGTDSDREGTRETGAVSRYVHRWMRAVLGERIAGIIAGRLFSKSATSLVLRVTTTGLAFGTSIVLAWLLGAEKYGQYKYVITWGQFLVLFASLGFDQLLIREVATLRSEQHWARLRGLLVYSNTLVTGTGIILGIVMVGVVYALIPEGDPLRIVFLWGVLFLPLQALMRLRQATMQGLGAPVIGQLPDSVMRPAGFLGIIGILYAFQSEWEVSASTVMGAQVAMATAAFVCGTWLVARTLPDSVKNASRSIQSKKWLVAAMPMAFIGAMYVANKYADIILLGMLTSSADVGVYALSSQIASIVTFVLIAANMVIAPEFSRLYTEDDMDGLEALAQNSAAIIFVASIGLFAFITIAGPPLLELYGKDFEAGYYPMTILAGGHVMSAAAGSVGFLLLMTGNERIAAINVGATVVLNIVLNLLLIPRLGLMGASIATGTSVVVVNALQAIACYKVIGMKTTVIGFLLHRSAK